MTVELARVVPLPTEPSPPNILEKIRMVNTREGGLIEAFVPISLIYQEDVPIDEVHVKELADSMENEMGKHSKTGQLSPVLLAEIPGFDRFFIVDGFHRVPALQLIGQEEVFATVRPQSTGEELIDLRILAARIHRSVRFSRLAEWIEEAWNRSGWSDKISSMQAFSFRVSKTMTGKIIGLKPEEVEAIKAWVDRKCDQWHLSAGYIYNNLVVIRLAAPDLVRETRERKSGHKLEFITLEHLRAIAKTLPYRYELQRLVAQTAKEQILTVPKTRALAVAVVKAKTIEEAQEIIESSDWRVLESIYNPSWARGSTRKELRETEMVAGNTPQLLERFFEDEIEIARLTIENAVLAGRYTPQPIVTDLPEEPKVDRRRRETKINERNCSLNEKEIADIFSQFEDFKPTLIRYLSSKKGVYNYQDAEDILQEAAARIFLALRRGKFSHSSPDHWRSRFYKVVNYEAIELIRGNLGRKGQKKVRSLEEMSVNSEGEELENIHLAYEERGFEEVESNLTMTQHLRLVKEVLPLLGTEERRTFVLKAFFDLSNHEIAQIMGKDLNIVESTLSHVKEKFEKKRAGDPNWQSH